MKNRFISGAAYAALLSTVSLMSAQELKIEQLPAAVQNTIRTETNNGPTVKIERKMQNGRGIYDVTLQQANGQPKNIYLEENGTYVAPEAVTVASVPAAVRRGAFGRSRGAYTNEVAMNQLPMVVQRTINTETNRARLRRVQSILGPNSTNVIYQVALQQPRGTEKIIYLNPDGTYVQNNLAVGAGPTTSVGTRSSLSNATKVKLETLPVQVQHALKNAAGSAQIEDIDKGTADGKTVYEAAFKQNGQTVELRVDESGNAVNDNVNQTILHK